MVTPTSPKNMLIAGIVLVLLNVAVLAPLSTGGVADAVEEAFETYPLDSACEEYDEGVCEEIEDDWASSTSQRDYYAYSITNVNDVMFQGATPTYQKIGPVTYDITTTRTLIDIGEDSMTYSETSSFACAEDSEVSCDTEVSQLNIAFQTQVIGATGLAVDGIMKATRAGFSAGIMAKELESVSAGKATASGLAESMAMIQAGYSLDAANSSAMIGNGMYDEFDAYFGAMNLSGYNNMTGMGEEITYTMAMGGQKANFTDLSYGFSNAMMPTGESIPLTDELGVMVLAGHCDMYATASYSEVMADAANGFINVGTMQRASLWGFMAMVDYMGTPENTSDDMPDINTTIARDYALCYGVAGTFAMIHGGGDEAWYSTAESVNASTRMSNLLGVDLDNAVAMNLLFGGHLTATPTGLLATNADETAFGIATFLGMDAMSAIENYTLDQTQYATIAGWAGGWITSQSALPMVLLGGTGEMTADLFVNTSFGNEDPINGGYLTNSLNLGGAWQLLGASGGNSIALSPEQSGNVLYGPLGLTTSTGASIFLYGELSGMTPPINFSTMQAGAPMEWNEQTIAALYGVDTNAAAAMRALMMGPIYGTTADSFVPGYLMSTFGTTPYLTQSVNSWLLGWHDPVSAYLATGNPMDMSVGWASLETNETYYGSNSVSTGEGTTYTICTGEKETCDKGETLLEDNSTQLAWRNDAMMAATFGLIMPESLVGTTGGFLTGEGDLVDVSGYAIAEITCSGTSEVKGIPVDDCSANVDPVTRNIQAKLLQTFTLLDATPSALPVYFGTEIELKAEQVSGLIIEGSSSSTFYLDTRDHRNMASAPSMSDLTPVFEIQSASTIGDEDAEEMESKIVQNQDAMAYWTNFDHPVDFLTLLFWLAGIGLIGYGMVAAANTPTEEEMMLTSDDSKSYDTAIEVTDSEE